MTIKQIQGLSPWNTNHARRVPTFMSMFQLKKYLVRKSKHTDLVWLFQNRSVSVKKFSSFPPPPPSHTHLVAFDLILNLRDFEFENWVFTFYLCRLWLSPKVSDCINSRPIGPVSWCLPSAELTTLWSRCIGITAVWRRTLAGFHF